MRKHQFAGALEGAVEGAVEGAAVGTLEGAAVGTLEGASVGTLEGASVGTLEGAAVGTLEGASVGSLKGAVVGGRVVMGLGVTTLLSVGAGVVLLESSPPHAVSAAVSAIAAKRAIRGAKNALNFKRSIHLSFVFGGWLPVKPKKLPCRFTMARVLARLQSHRSGGIIHERNFKGNTKT